MKSRETATLYMILTTVEHQDEVLTVDNSADAFEAVWGFCTDNFDAMRLEDILYVADGIEAQLPFLADLKGLFSHLSCGREFLSIDRGELWGIFAQDGFNLEVAFYFVLDAHLEGVDIFDAGIGLFSERDLELVEIEGEGTKEIVGIDIESRC